MRSFEKWFNSRKPSADIKPDPESELPDGLWLRNGVVMFECENCHEDKEYFGEPKDFELGHPHNVCGGSPYCCP